MCLDVKDNASDGVNSDDFEREQTLTGIKLSQKTSGIPKYPEQQHAKLFPDNEIAIEGQIEHQQSFGSVSKPNSPSLHAAKASMSRTITDASSQPKKAIIEGKGLLGVTNLD